MFPAIFANVSLLNIDRLSGKSKVKAIIAHELGINANRILFEVLTHEKAKERLPPIREFVFQKKRNESVNKLE